MDNLTEQRPTDIGFIEQHFGDDWRLVAYIGPGRQDFAIEALQLYRGGTVRVHYFTEQGETT